MRIIATLAAATALAACHTTPAPPSEPVQAKAGKWRQTQTFVSITGAPQGSTPPPTTPSVTRKCLTAADMPGAIWQQGQSPPVNVKVDGDHFTAILPTSVEHDDVLNESATVSMKIEGSFDATHYDTMFTVTAARSSGAPDIVTRTHVTGEYVGPCQSAPPSGDPNAAP